MEDKNRLIEFLDGVIENDKPSYTAISYLTEIKQILSGMSCLNDDKDDSSRLDALVEKIYALYNETGYYGLDFDSYCKAGIRKLIKGRTK